MVLEELSVFLETSTLTSSISVNFNHLKEIKNDDEPKAKKACFDTLSDSDDNLTSEDLEDIRREFGQEMVEKIRPQNNKKVDLLKGDLDSCNLRESWKDIGGELIVFTCRGMEASSKVL